MDMGMRGPANWNLHFLAPTHPHLGCLETPPSTLFLMLPLFSVFTQGTPYLGDPPRSKWHFVWRAHPKKLHLQRKSLHLGRFYLQNVIWHCGRPSKIQGDRKLHIGRYQFTRFRENATSFSKHTLSNPLTCASMLCIREDWIKPNRTEAISHRSELCWSWRKKPSALAQRWTPGWLGATGEQVSWRLRNLATDGNSSLFLTTTVVQVGCRLQVSGIIIWEEYFEWSIC